MSADPYDVLGVPKGATPEEVKKAYRRKARKHHPDRHGGDGEKMARVNEAYLILGDDANRRAFDETGQKPNAAGLEGHVRDMLMKMLDGVMDGMGPNLGGDLLDSLIGSARISRDNTARQVADIEKKVDVTERRREQLHRRGQKDQPSPIDWALTARLTRLRGERAAHQRGLEVFDGILKLLADCESRTVELRIEGSSAFDNRKASDAPDLEQMAEMLNKVFGQKGFR